jgi:ferredoxin
MKTKIHNLKLFAFVGMFFIFSCLTLYAFASNNQIYTYDPDEESISIDNGDGAYALKIKRSLCIACEACLEIAPEKLEIRSTDNKVGKKAGVTSITEELADELVAICPVDVFEKLTE